MTGMIVPTRYANRDGTISRRKVRISTGSRKSRKQNTKATPKKIGAKRMPRSSAIVQKKYDDVIAQSIKAYEDKVAADAQAAQEATEATVDSGGDTESQVS